MMRRPPIRQGTSRIVPIVVSAGLAVGVFCGLLFGLGTGKHKAAAETPQASNGVKVPEEATVDPNSIDTSRKPRPVAIPPTSAPAATPPAGSAGAAAAAEPPAPVSTKLVVEVKPEAAAQAAKVFVDGKEIAGTTIDVAMPPGETKKKVNVLVKAPGYKDVDQDVDVEGESINVKFELPRGRVAPPPPPPVASTPDPDPNRQAPSATQSTPPSTAPKIPPTKPPATPPKKKPGGGLIDI
jgi:hypothetical protein